MRTLLRLKLKKQMMDNESVNTMKEEEDVDKKNAQPSSPAAAASTNNDPSTSLTHELQKDTDSEKAAITTECNDPTITMNDTNNQLNTTNQDSNDDEELIIPDGENILSLIPQILRSAVERSRQAEELILRDGMIKNDAVAPTDERSAVMDVNSFLCTESNSNLSSSLAAAAATTTKKNSSKNLLQLPKSWKRSNYASKTLAEIEEYVAKSNNNNNSTKKPTGSCNTNNDEENENSFFTVEYNECSLAALANWATMMDTTTSASSTKNKKQSHPPSPTTTTDKTTTTSPPPWQSTTTTTWTKYKHQHEKKRATSTTKYNMPIPPPNAFRMCGVCQCFGHYEVECDLLVDYNDEGDEKKKEEEEEEDVVIVGASSNDDDEEECSNKNKKKGRKRKRLEGQEKQGVISSLAKELRIQRTLEELLSNARREEKAKKEEEKEMMMKNGNDDDNDDASYWVTSQRCNICLSALGDESMLVCDGCDELYHMHCLDPPLHSVPEGDWFCDACQAYDDDISSTVDVEGCDGFVIEQRKRSLMEEERRRRRRSEEGYVGVSIGGENRWINALTILTQEDPAVVSMAKFKAIYAGRNNDDGNSGRTEFVENEVVWAKRQVGSIKYWPGIVSKVAKKGLEVLYFPLGDNNLNRLHHHSELLPFFPYFEDLGYDQVTKNDLFRRALELSVIRTGFKTLGQALNYARCGTQMSLQRGTNEFRNTTAARALQTAGWVAPIGWENAEVDEVDGIMIVARSDADGNKKLRPTLPINNATTASDSMDNKSNNNDECNICQERGDLLVCDGGGKGGGCDKAFHLACIDRDEIPEGDWICMSCATELGFNCGVEGHEWGSEDAPPRTDMTNNATAEFCVNEIIGGIMSWKEVTSPKVCYGTVLSVDVEAKSALVRTIPLLSESAGSYERLFPSNPFMPADKSIQIRANDTGSTIWMPLNRLSFVSGRAAEKDSYEFTNALVSHMKHEQKSFDERCRQAEIDRERFMVELSLPIPDTNIDHSPASLPAARSIPPPPAPAPPPVSSHQNSSASERFVITKTPSGMLQCPKCSFVTSHRCGMANHLKYCLDGRDYTYAE